MEKEKGMKDNKDKTTDGFEKIKPKKMKDRLKLNRQYTEISLYVIGTCVVLYVLYGILSYADNFFTALGSSLAWIVSILKPVVIGFIISYLLYPLCEKVEAQCKKRPFFQDRPKTAHYFGVVITIGGIILGIIILISLLIITITQQFNSLHDASLFQIIQAFTQSLNQMYQGILTWLEKMNVKSEQAQQIVDAIRNGLTSNFGTGVQGIGHTLNNIKSVGSTILFSIIFSVYFMLDWPSLHTLIQEDFFNADEKEILRRGRNASPHTKAKNATSEQYMKATALEACLGYLYLYDHAERLNVLMDRIIQLGDQL